MTAAAARRTSAVLAPFLALATAAAAQPSTSGLGEAETRRWRVEASAGRSNPLLQDVDGHGSHKHRDVAALLAARWATAPFAVSASAWALRRTRTSRYDSSEGTSVIESHTALVAIGAGADYPVRMGRRVTIAPSAGLGIVPWSSGRTTYTDGPSEGSLTYRSAERGILFTFGIAVRAGRVVVEQHLVGVHGVSRSWTGEYYPLTVGWRF